MDSLWAGVGYDQVQGYSRDIHNYELWTMCLSHHIRARIPDQAEDQFKDAPRVTGDESRAR